jgi:hypothetical protein
MVALLSPEGLIVRASLGLGYRDATENTPGMFHRVYPEPVAVLDPQLRGR